MKIRPVVPLPLKGQVLYAAGSAAFTMLERMILLYMPFFYLPPGEYGLPGLIPDRTYLGVLTILGAALMTGRIFDGLADPLFASLSDNSRSPLGRRKLFLLLGGLPLALSAALVFFPPFPGAESPYNGAWLTVLMVLFYLSFTAYVNPYLALIPELGHSNALRINLSTLVALFGLIGMVLVTIGFPALAGWIGSTGFDLRTAYRISAVVVAALAAILLYLATTGFSEKRHCLPGETRPVGAWKSLSSTFAVRPFRIFLGGEIFLQFAMNLVTLGLIYYAVVIFRHDQEFIIVLASITIGTALACFPLVNILARRIGKKKVILAGVASLAICGLGIFIFSFRMEGFYYYLSLVMFALAGFPLAVLTILINPTIGDLARADYFKTGQRREAMFFGARAIPLKLSIALAGVVFAYLLSAFGRDLASPLGVQLSALVVSIAAACSYVFFRLYPEEQVMADLEEEGSR